MTTRGPGKIGLASNFVSKVLGVTQKNREHAKIEKKYTDFRCQIMIRELERESRLISEVNND